MKQPKALAPNPDRQRAMDPDARNDQLVALAIDLAEQQLRDGTASAQVITHYLKLGSPTARLERKKLEEEVKLVTAKTEAIESAKNIEELYREAKLAITTYRGGSDDDTE